MTVQYSNNFNDTTIFSDTNGRFTLKATVVTTYTVPGDDSLIYQARFEYASNSNVFVGYNTTPTLPANNTVESTGTVEFKPCKRQVKGGDVLSLLSPDTTAYCGVALQLLPSGR